MTKSESANWNSTIWQLILISSLVVLFSLISPQSVLAAPPDPVGAGKTRLTPRESMARRA